MISETFSFAEPFIVDHWLDHLLEPLDRRYARGTIQRQAVSQALTQAKTTPFSNGTIPGKVLIRDGRWVQGLQIDHINSDPSDNRRVNLQMLTRTENLGKRIHLGSPSMGHKSIIVEPGVRIYKIRFNIEVDDEDADLLEPMYKKYASGRLLYAIATALYRSGGSGGVASKALKTNGIIIPKGLSIDHKNGNPFDNRLANLEVVTRTENNRRRFNRAA